MSSLASWSFTHKATHWPLVGQDSWGGVKQYGPPVVFACDYSAQAKRMTDSKGVEFTSSQILYTERDSIKPGDMVLIGEFSGDPLAAKAFEVRSVKRDADVFEQLADDFEVAT